MEPLVVEQKVEQDYKHGGGQCVEHILEVEAFEGVDLMVPSEGACDGALRASPH